MRKSVASKLIGMTLAAALVAGTVSVRAADADEATGGYGPYYGIGPGMGPGMMWGGGYGPGYGMMGGYGPGMMGGYDMGPGMMGGYGGGYGMGPGMMGYGPLGILDLSDEQRAKINKIIDTEQKQQWGIMGQMMEVQNKMRDLYSVDEPDPKKVGAAYAQLAKLRQQMLEMHIQASNQVQQVLTKEQRERLREWTRGGWGPHPGPRSGAGPDSAPRRNPTGRTGMMGPGGAPGMMGR